MDKSVIVTDQRRLNADADADLRYWRSRPVIERFAAVERLRQQYIAHHFDVEPGFQRIYRVAQLERR